VTLAVEIDRLPDDLGKTGARLGTRR